MIAKKPMVFKRDGRQRYGKGFSREELKKAGLGVREARKIGFPVDPRRKTVYKENISAIKKFLKSKKASKPKKRRKSKS